MGFLLGPRCQHITGHKSLSESGPILTLMPKKTVSIPLNAGNTDEFELSVEPGQHVLRGQLLAVNTKSFPVPIYASVSGTITQIEKRSHHSLKPKRHITIELDETQESVEPWSRVDSPEAIFERIKQAGIIGLGGAGFPTFVKYQKTDTIEYILINAVECEPYITSDYRQLMDDPDAFLTGCQLLAQLANQAKVKVCVKESHPDLIERLKQKAPTDIEIVSVPDVYPMGWERVLVRQVLKKEYDRLPSEAGAIVSNASTALAVYRACVLGHGLLDQVCTFSGECLSKPTNVKVPVGMAVEEIIEQLGGLKSDSIRLIAGGPMMGRSQVKTDIVVDRAVNAITILPAVDRKSEPCLRCGRCVDHCPSSLQPVRISDAVNAKDQVMMSRLEAQRCIECGLCTLVCPSHIEVTENVRKAKRLLQMAGGKR